MHENSVLESLIELTHANNFFRHPLHQYYAELNVSVKGALVSIIFSFLSGKQRTNSSSSQNFQGNMRQRIVI